MSQAPPHPTDAAALSVSRRLTLILEALRRAIAAHAGRHRASAPLVLLLWPYLHRVAARFEALTARVRSGRLPILRTRPAAARTRSPAQSRLPRKSGLFLQMGSEIRCLGSQLKYLLADPEMAALLGAEPLAGRILRPLCRMFGITPDPDLPPALFAPHRRPASPTRPLRERPPADASDPIAASFAIPRGWPTPA